MQKSEKGYELIGRVKEVNKIINIAEKVEKEKRPYTVLIIGKEGIGRTAFINYSGKQLSSLKQNYFVLSTINYRGMPGIFFPIDQIIMELLKLKVADIRIAPDELVASIKSKLEKIEIPLPDSEINHHAGLLADLMSCAIKDAAGQDEKATPPIEKYLFGVRKILSALMENRNLAIILDDFNKYSPDSRGIVRALRTGLGGKPVLWVLAVEEATEEIKRFADEIIELPPLTKEDTARYLKESFSDLEPFPETLIEVLYTSSKGIPGLLNYHISLLIENRVLELNSAGKWVYNQERLVPENLPVDPQTVINLKIGSLDEREREILLLAATIGEVFWDDAVLALVRSEKNIENISNPALVWPDDSEIMSVQTTLDSLCKKGFITRLESQEFYGVAEYSFAYEGLREHLIASLPPERRGSFSMIIARWLEVVSGERIGEYGEIIARHLELAGEKEEASYYYIEAAKVAKSRYLFERAYELYQKAIENIKVNKTTLLLDILHEMGNMAQSLGKMEIALECFSNMLKLAWKSVSRSKAGAALSKIGRIYRQQGDFRAAMAFLERSMGLYKQAGDRRGIASTTDDLGNIHFLMGNSRQAISLYKEALKERIEIKDARGIALSYEHIGQFYRSSGNYDEAEKYVKQALEIRRQIRDDEGTISCLNVMGIMAYERGNSDAAITIWKEALEHAVKTNNLRMMEYLNNNIGEVFLETGQLNAAEPYLKQCMEIALMISDKRVEAEVYKNLGLLHMKGGNTKASRDFLNKSIVVAREIGSKEQMASALRALGQLEGFAIFDEGALAGAAESYFQEALDIFKSMGNESEYLRTMEIYGKYLFDHGRVQEAISVMESVLNETTIKTPEIIERIKATIKKMKHFASS